jgi:nucleotide-binding universal stress UspA family protein
MRIERIVVGVDFSRPGIDAAKWVTGHFAPDAEFILAHVIDTPHTPGFLADLVPDDEAVAAREREEAESRLREIASGLAAKRVRTIVREGPAHEELATVVANTGADLVAVGPHGDNPRPWKMLGTTAERLARACSPAVLVVTNPRNAPVRRVLVAIDDSPIRAIILDWTKTVADASGAAVTAVHVLPNAKMSHVLSPVATGHGGAEPTARVGAEMFDKANRWLASISGALLGHERARSIVAQGKPGDVILETARGIDADFIVIGRRAGGTLMPALAGSTVSTVLHGAQAPVLVVTEEPDHWPAEGSSWE